MTTKGLYKQIWQILVVNAGSEHVIVLQILGGYALKFTLDIA